MTTLTVTHDNIGKGLKGHTGQYRELTVTVTNYHEVAGKMSADNPDDYYGYWELEYDIIAVHTYSDDDIVNFYHAGDNLDLPVDINDDILLDQIRAAYLEEN